MRRCNRSKEKLKRGGISWRGAKMGHVDAPFQNRLLLLLQRRIVSPTPSGSTVGYKVLYIGLFSEKAQKLSLVQNAIVRRRYEGSHTRVLQKMHWILIVIRAQLTQSARFGL